MFRYLFLASIAVSFASQLAAGQTPLTATWQVLSMPDITEPDTSSFVDIPGSAQVLTIPSGTAYMRWSGAIGVTGNETLVRPVIGDTIGEVLFWGHGTGGWAGHVSQSTGKVKLQIRRTDSGGINFQSGKIEWTLMVLPDAPAGKVPAISTWGLGIMVLMLLGAGTLMMRRRQPSTSIAS